MIFIIFYFCFITLRYRTKRVPAVDSAQCVTVSAAAILFDAVVRGLQTDDLGKCQRCHFYYFFNLSYWTLRRDSFTALLGKQIKRCVFWYSLCVVDEPNVEPAHVIKDRRNISDITVDLF